MDLNVHLVATTRPGLALIGALAVMVGTTLAIGAPALAIAVVGGWLGARAFERRLAAARGELRCEREHRARIEHELGQARKLESVGRLASGIAHEINTPVQFVSDSCAFLDSAATDLASVLANRRAAFAAATAGTITWTEAAARINACDQSLDLDYLIEQMPQAIARALSGLERVSTIVRAMKEFAYTDQAEQVAADLNRAILSTLTVAHAEYKYVADVKTELGELTPVRCHIGELNQVVLNLVVNAAHAIADAVGDSERRGTITIRTRELDRHAVIEIEDDGAGIPLEIIDKIFDPFFTTKAIGKGTGQGLAIARSVVVDKHRGEITVASTPGHGTTFTIRLPIAGLASESTPHLDPHPDPHHEAVHGEAA